MGWGCLSMGCSRVSWLLTGVDAGEDANTIRNVHFRHQKPSSPEFEPLSVILAYLVLMWARMIDAQLHAIVANLPWQHEIDPHMDEFLPTMQWDGRGWVCSKGEVLQHPKSIPSPNLSLYHLWKCHCWCVGEQKASCFCRTESSFPNIKQKMYMWMDTCGRAVAKCKIVQRFTVVYLIWSTNMFC